jgi:hypothetical protein
LEDAVIDDITRLRVLYEEISVLESRLEPQDTGHLRTAISVLQDRCREIERGMETGDRVAWALQCRREILA